MNITIKIYDQYKNYIKTKIYKTLEELVNEYQAILAEGDTKQMMFKCVAAYDQKIYFIKFLFDNVNDRSSD